MSPLAVLLAAAVAAAASAPADPVETQRLTQSGLMPIADAVRDGEQVLRVSLEGDAQTPRFKPFAVSLLLEKQGFATIDLTSSRSPHLNSTPVLPSYWTYFAGKRDAALAAKPPAAGVVVDPKAMRMTIEVTQAKGPPLRQVVTPGAPPPPLAAVADELLLAAAAVSPCATRGDQPAVERLLACYGSEPTVSALAQ